MVLRVLWLVLIFLVIRLIYKQLTRPKPEISSNTELVKCAHCGVYIKQSQALKSGHKTYCRNKQCQP